MTRHEQNKLHRQTGLPELELERRYEDFEAIAAVICKDHQEELTHVIAQAYFDDGGLMRDLINKVEERLENERAA
jgi:hypothetical protein